MELAEENMGSRPEDLVGVDNCATVVASAGRSGAVTGVEHVRKRKAAQRGDCES
jgi:hypothetical protein